MKRFMAGLISFMLALSTMGLPAAAEPSVTMTADIQTEPLTDEKITEETEPFAESETESQAEDQSAESEDFTYYEITATLSEGKLSWDTQTEFDGAQISYFNGTETVCVDQQDGQSEFVIPDDAKEFI